MRNPSKDMLSQLLIRFYGLNAMSKIIPYVESLFLTIGIVFYLNNYYVLMIPNFWLFLMCITMNLCLFLVSINRKRLITYVILFGILSFTLLIPRMMNLRLGDLLKDLYHWCMTYYGEPLDYQKGYAYLISILIIALVSILLTLLHILKFTRYLFAFILPVLLIVAAMNEIEVDKLSIGLILFYSLWVVVEVLGRVFLKDITKEENRLATLYLAPVYGMMLFIVILLPAKSEPIQWNGIKNAIAMVEEQGIRIANIVEYIFNSNNREFKFSIAGYQEEEENKLGGAISFYDKTSLKVSTLSKTTQKGYLIGSIYDVYTGSSWTKSVHDYTSDNGTSQESYYDYLELLNGLGREYEQGRDIKNLVAKKQFQISYEDIRTKTLFYPLKTYQITSRKQSKYNETKLSNLVLSGSKGSNFTYEVTFYELNLNSEKFKEILRSEDAGFASSDDIINNMALSIFSNKKIETNKNITALRNELVNRRERIYEQYTKLPESITERTKELAYQLTKDYKNDYDKLKAIEYFLSNYDYDTKVKKVPEDKDFVDYFLFEERRGYCTYYATAMSILARINHIPTRYVEGFVIDYNEGDGEQSYYVKNNNAHAWVEAYIKGIGWISFEPTVPYYEGRYTSWKEENEDLVYDMDDYDLDYNDRIDEILDSVNNESSEGSLSFIESKEDIMLKEILRVVRILIILLFMMISLIVILLLYYIILEKRYRSKLINKKDYKKLRILCHELFMYLKLDGYVISADETFLTFSKRIGDRVTLNNTSLSDLVFIYQKVRYGNQVLGMEEEAVFLTFLEEYRLIQRKKIGRFKMFLNRFIYLNSKYE